MKIYLCKHVHACTKHLAHPIRKVVQQVCGCLYVHTHTHKHTHTHTHIYTQLVHLLEFSFIFFGQWFICRQQPRYTHTHTLTHTHTHAHIHTACTLTRKSSLSFSVNGSSLGSTQIILYTLMSKICRLVLSGVRYVPLLYSSCSSTYVCMYVCMYV